MKERQKKFEKYKFILFSPHFFDIIIVDYPYYTIKKQKEEEMFHFLSEFFQKNSIHCIAPIRLSDCRITKPYLLERCGIQSGTVFIFAVPYFTKTCEDPHRNISAYAISKDYHIFFRGLFDELIPQLREKFPQNRFVGFADHSPINEIDAAVRAGLGVLGKNHMLLTPLYSSYVFLGEIITDAELPAKALPLRFCSACGACQQVCPANACGTCLSALTQKKGVLTDSEANLIRKQKIAWGCDLCQAVCPHTQKALESGTIYTPIPFFEEDPIAHLTVDRINTMTQEVFDARAYSWRGKDPILRNLKLIEDKNDEEDSQCSI